MNILKIISNFFKRHQVEIFVDDAFLSLKVNSKPALKIDLIKEISFNPLKEIKRGKEGNHLFKDKFIKNLNSKIYEIAEDKKWIKQDIVLEAHIIYFEDELDSFKKMHWEAFCENLGALKYKIFLYKKSFDDKNPVISKNWRSQ